MATTGSTPQTSFESRFGALDGVSLIDTIVKRRSRRFALGHELDGGPLSYRSQHDPVPLTAEEEAVIVFAGAGMTGYALSEAPFAPGREPDSSSGNILTSPFGRTIATPDGINTAILFVINDDGAFQIRRPQDYPRESLSELAELARRHEFVELYDRAKIRVTDRRPEVLRQPPVTPPFNRWSTNLPGSTYFVIVSDITPLLFSLIFFLLGEAMEFMVYDERNHYRPAGLKRFMRSKGGRLHDDPNESRVGSILDFESYLMELAGVEQGLMLQNMQLAVEGLGLGGLPAFRRAEVSVVRRARVPDGGHIDRQADPEGTRHDGGDERVGEEPDHPPSTRPRDRRRGDGQALLPTVVRVDGRGRPRLYRSKVRGRRSLH